MGVVVETVRKIRGMHTDTYRLLMIDGRIPALVELDVVELM